MVTGPVTSGGLTAALNTAASGLTAAATEVSVAAGNIANLNTPGYQSRQPDLVSLSSGGVAVSGISTDTTPAPSNSSNVDLAHESLQLTRAKLLYSANAAVVRTTDQMLGTLLDTVNRANDDTRQK